MGCSNRFTSREAVVCIIAILAILTNLGCLSFVSSRLVNSSLKRNVHFDAEETGNDCVCVTCELLTKHAKLRASALLEKLQRKQEGEKCCACSTQQTEHLMELLTLDRESEPPHFEKVQNSDLKHVSAHKSFAGPFYDETYFSKGSNVPLYFNMTRHEQWTEHAQNVEVLPSGFVIQYSGLYKVYSEVYFGPNTNSKSCKEFDVKTWEHVVVRMRPNERQNSGILTRSLHTCCDECSGDKESSYSAGVFYLEAGDHLHAEVSGQGLIRFQKDSSFWGVAMLGST